MVPKGLLTFLGFLGNAEFSPWRRLPELRTTEVIKKKFVGVFVTASDDILFFVCFCLLFVCLFLFRKKCLCYPRSGDEGSILA